jgi:hypothetical protein
VAYKPAPMPGPDVPLVDGAGKMRPEWRNYFSNMTTRNLRDVGSTEPTNTQSLVFNATSGKYEPGAN